MWTCFLTNFGPVHTQKLPWSAQALAGFQVLPKLLCPCPSQMDREEEMGWKALGWDKDKERSPNSCCLSKTDPAWGIEFNLLANQSE